MTQNRYLPGVDRFKIVRPGDQPSASEHNKITAAILRQQQAGMEYPKHPTRAIRLFRLTDIMGQFGSGDSSAAHNRSGVVQAYDPDLNAFKDTANTETKENIVDALDGYYDVDELVWCVYLEQSGKWHPLNPTMVRVAVTVYDSPGNDPPYPDCDTGRVFPIKFARLRYDATDSTGTNHSLLPLDGSDSDPDEYVFNLFKPTDESEGSSYIPPGTPIAVFKCGKQWFTNVCCYGCPQSSTSVSVSDSSSSDSSWSHSSYSVSSSESQSISASSSPSVSVSSTGSSVSISESSPGSSVSVSESSDYVCVDVLGDVEFDGDTCQLTACYKTLCFRNGLFVSVSGEC